MLSMKPLLVLADDLTGAADSAARCHHGGLSATIYLGPPQPPLPTGVISFTSDSRHLPPTAAARRVETVVAPLVGMDARWYKKIDSTLRGNLGEELDTLFDLLDFPCAVVCPAFPAQRRGLADGFLVAPGLPASLISLPQRLREGSRRPVEAIPLAMVRADGLAAHLRAATARGSQLLTVDALTDNDLHHVLDAVESTLPDALLCGSAGLIGALALRQSQTVASITRSVAQRQGDLRSLLVVGSGSEMAHRQIVALCTAHTVTRLIVDPDHSSSVDLDSISPISLIHLPLPAPDAILDGPMARRWAEELAAIAISLIERSKPELLILSGGDTAVHVLTRLGIDRLTVLAELLPGMPLCRGLSSTGGRYSIILKPGSFGDDETFLSLLEKSVEFLSQESEDSTP
jgi:uncharacterized protein YgbK (DUF1537 family)